MDDQLVEVGRDGGRGLAVSDAGRGPGLGSEAHFAGRSLARGAGRVCQAARSVGKGFLFVCRAADEHVAAAHIKTLETKCVTLIEHYKKVQGERKELLDKFNTVAQQAEEAQEKLVTLPQLQQLCRQLEEKLRRVEDERNAAALDGEAKQRLLSQLDDDFKRLTADRALQAAALAALEKRLQEQQQHLEQQQQQQPHNDSTSEEREQHAVAVAALEERLRQHNEGEARLAKQLQQVEEERTQEKRAMEQLQKRLTSEHEQDGALREQLEAQKKLSESLQRDLAAAVAASGRTDASPGQAVPETEALRAELAASMAAREGLAAELQLAKNAKGSSAEMLSHFKEENKRLIGELKAAKDSLRTHTEEYAALAAQQQKSVRDAQEGAKEKDRALAQQEEASQAEIVMLRKERATYAELMAARDVKLAQQQQQIEAAEKSGAEKIRQLEAAVEAERRQREEESHFAAERSREQAAKVSRLKEEVTELRAARQREQGNAAERTAQLEVLERERARLDMAAMTASAERDDLKKRLEQREAQLGELNAAMERQAQELAAVKTAAAPPAAAEDGTPSIAEEEAKKLKVLLRMAKQHLQDYREKFNTSSQELRQERDARQKLEQEAASKQAHAAEIEEALEKSRGDVGTLRETLSVVKAKCMELQTEQAEAAERYNALREKAAALAQAGTGIEEWTKSSIDREEVRCLKQEIGDLRQALLELNERNLHLVSEQRSAETTQHELQTARAEGAKTRRQLEELQTHSRAAEATHHKALATLRTQMQKELDAKTAELGQLEQETSAKFEELSSQLKLFRQRTKKTMEQKDLLVLQLKKRLKDGKDVDVGDTEASVIAAAPVASAAAKETASAAAAAKSEDPAANLGQEDAREKLVQLSGVVRDNSKLLKTYQQRISELERGKQGGDANIAYLKNVLIRYFEKPSAENHKRLIPVLRVLLGLSDSEVSQIEAVRETANKGWFF